MLLFKYVIGTVLACLGILFLATHSALLMGKPQYSQKFRPAWARDPELHWVTKIEGDDTHISCSLCDVKLRTHKKSLQEHAKTQKHQRHVDTAKRKLIATKITDKRYEPNYGTALAEGRTCLFVAEHCSINTVDHLSEMYKTAFPDADAPKKMAMKRTRCSQMITDVIGNHFLSELVKDIGDRPYSLILDESNDVSSTKYLGVVIRYFSLSKKKVVSTFLGFVELDKCDAQSIVTALKTFLSKIGLKLSKLCGIGTDNASVMVGVHNGVYAKLKSEVPHLILIRCVCHSLQLAASYACKETFPDHLDSLIEDTYNWFSLSSKRKSQYLTLYQKINDKNPLKIKRACDTRWLSISVAVDAILEQYDELKQHFKEVHQSEKCYKARVLYQMYSDERNRLYLKFLSPVLTEVRATNLNFEAAYQDPTKLASDLMLLLQKLGSNILDLTNQNILNCNLKERLKPVFSLGGDFDILFSKLSAISPTEPTNDFHISLEKLQTVRSNCLNFMLLLIKQIRQRVPDNIDILQRLSMFSADQCLRKNVATIPTGLVTLLGKSPSDAFKINTQYSTLVSMPWKETKDTVKFWSEVSEYKNSSYVNPFIDIVELVFRALSLPHSNADVERTFSVMNIVKNKLRNKMMTRMLNAILYIRYGLKLESKCCATYELNNTLLERIRQFRCLKLVHDVASTSTSSNVSASTSSNVSASTSSNVTSAVASTSRNVFASTSSNVAATEADDFVVTIHMEEDEHQDQDVEELMNFFLNTNI